MLLGAWQRMPWQAEKPDPNFTPNDNDRFAQNVARPGRLDGPSNAGRWIAYHIVKFRPQARVRKEGGVIAFTEIVGRAEVWLDGKKVADKTDFAPAPLNVPVAAGEQERHLTVLVQAEEGKPAGFGKLVAVRETR